MSKKSFLAGLSVILIAIITLVISCGKSSDTGSNNGNGNGNNPPPASNAVSIVNMSFKNATLTVTAGTTVTWTNNDGMAHTVTADDNSFNSGTIAGGGKFSRAFSTKGTYTYHCTIHPGMTGTIVVN